MKDYPWFRNLSPPEKNNYLFTIDHIPLKRVRYLTVHEMRNRLTELKQTHKGSTVRAYKLTDSL